MIVVGTVRADDDGNVITERPKRFDLYKYRRKPIFVFLISRTRKPDHFRALIGYTSATLPRTAYRIVQTNTQLNYVHHAPHPGVIRHSHRCLHRLPSISARRQVLEGAIVAL